MRIEPLGDAAAILRDLDEPAHSVAALLSNLPGIVDAVASYDTVGLYFEPGSIALSQIERFALDRAGKRFSDETKSFTIPVCYELGQDLEAAADTLGLTGGELVERHCSRVYRCYAIGFTPGFPYLGYLDEAIASLPRRTEPRVRVEAGSVGITGKQTGIYPSTGPGGWHLIGRSPLTIVDMDEAYFPIAAGDSVRFVRIDRAKFEELKGSRL